MAINFPNAPTNGNTYTYQNTVFTFVKVGTDVGYWRVDSPNNVGAASSSEINAGTNSVKYVTPQALTASKHVRESESTGVTTLDYAGGVRLETTSQGINVTGKIFINGVELVP